MTRPNYFYTAIQNFMAKIVLIVNIIRFELFKKVNHSLQIFNSPFVCLPIMGGILFFIMTAIESFCNLFGIIYPIWYEVYLFNENPIDIRQLMSVNKYWMLFSTSALIDSFFGFILHLIPGFFYFKFIMIYLLVRNDFVMSETVFGCIKQYVMTLISYVYRNHQMRHNTPTTEFPVTATM